MEGYEHLKLPIYKTDIDRKKQRRGGNIKEPEGRKRATFATETIKKAEEIYESFAKLRDQFSGRLEPTLIFEIKINDKIDPNNFEKILDSMGIKILSIAEGKKGFWVVFSDDAELKSFKNKLKSYGDKKSKYKYDFFNAIDSIGDIPREKKIGKKLKGQPPTDDSEFIDIELWKTKEPRKNEKFIQELKEAYPDSSKFRISDQLITKSLVLLRVKLNKQIFDEIIELKEIARADRPSTPTFNSSMDSKPNISDLIFNAPPEDATGILIVDSGLVSNHPMLEKCIGAEENFQSGESSNHDTVGHGTGVAGCAAYGDIEDCLEQKTFSPSNWIFSAKVMFAETNDIGGTKTAIFDQEKLFEHQFKDAIESFLRNSDYQIKVVNISLGSADEVWKRDYNRQLPLAALIDELVLDYPDVVFIIAAGNHSPLAINGTDQSISEIKDNYPTYLHENPDFSLINPATSALALTIGSIAGVVKNQQERYGDEQIKTPIALENQPSPFSRTGPGINDMIKPELVEYGGNLILFNSYQRIVIDKGGKILLLNNQTTGNLLQHDFGTSYAAPRAAHLAGQITNRFPHRTGNFIKNMLLVGASYPYTLDKHFYHTKDKKNAERIHLKTCGYGVSNFEQAIHSYDNRVVLWDEDEIGLDQIKIYTLDLPDLFFNEPGKKKITVTLTFNPETRSTRGDSYLANKLNFRLFHSTDPELLIDKLQKQTTDSEEIQLPQDLDINEIQLFPGVRTREKGCHQKAWKEFIKGPQKKPKSPFTLVLVNHNKWTTDTSRKQNYCVSVTFQHEEEINLYNQIRAKVQTRTRIR